MGRGYELFSLTKITFKWAYSLIAAVSRKSRRFKNYTTLDGKLWSNLNIDSLLLKLISLLCYGPTKFITQHNNTICFRKWQRKNNQLQALFVGILNYRMCKNISIWIQCHSCDRNRRLI